MSGDFAWLTERSRDIYEKYAGKWIAVLNGEVVGVGDMAVQAANRAERTHPRGDFVLEAVDPGPERV